MSKKFSKNPDEPIVGSNQDKFGRKDFAIGLGEALVKIPEKQSITVGLYGSWGCGKTSVINMTTEYLSNKHSDEVIVIKFNPWIFSSTESLHMAFFSTLANCLGKKLHSNGGQIANELQRYGEITGSIGEAASVLFPAVGPMSKLLKGALKFFGKKNSTGTNVEETRKRVDSLLKESGQRIVVIIDDIDRLDSEEIHQVFKLVKNIAHFSNISYLLSFDHAVVAKALSERYPNNPLNGENFIDKIIQLPLYVPTVDQELLNKYLIEELNVIIASHKLNISEDDMSRFQSMYFARDAWELFTTPRKVIRYLNTVDFSFSQLKNEVSFTDIALIDMFRNFYPELYRTISSNKEILLRSGAYGSRNDDNVKTAMIKTIFNTETPRGFIVTAVRELFPSFEWVLGGSSYGDGFEAEWEESKRVCTSKYFNRYFGYGIPLGDMPDADLDSFIESLGDQKVSISKAEQLFEKLTKDKDIGLIISKLRRKEEKLSEETSKKLAFVIANKGGTLSRQHQALVGDMLSPYVQSAVLAIKLMNNVNEPIDSLKKLLNEVPINYAAELLRWIRVNSENEKREENFKPLIPSDEVGILGNLLADRIKVYASKNYLQKEFPDDVSHLMWIWNKWGNKDDIKDYFAKSFKKNHKLAIDFLVSYVGNAYEMETGKKTRSDFRREAYNAVAETIDPEIFVEPLTKEFGEDVGQANTYPSGRSSENEKSFEYSVAEQFLYLHNNQPSEKSSETDIIEGEVIENN